MKSLSLMSWVLATRPETSSTAPRPNRMPLGLMRNTWPLALMLPRMLEGMPPMTRFSTTAELSGCRNCTYSFAPTENCCQLMAAFWLVCLTRVPLAPGVLMLAWPPTTCPPVGFARAMMGDRAPRPTAVRRSRGRRRRMSVRASFTEASKGRWAGLRYVMALSFYSPKSSYVDGCLFDAWKYPLPNILPGTAPQGDPSENQRGWQIACPGRPFVGVVLQLVP